MYFHLNPNEIGVILRLITHKKRRGTPMAADLNIKEEKL